MPALGLYINVSRTSIHLHREVWHVSLQEEGTSEQRRNKDDSSREHTEFRAERCGSAFGGSSTRWRSASRGNGTVRLAGKVSGGRSSALATSTLETRTSAGTLLKEVGGLAGESGELVGVDGNVPGVGLVRASGGLAVRLVATVAGGSGGLSECVLELGEVIHLADLATLDLDESVVGVFLGVFVDETSGVDGGHVGAVDGSNFVELALVLVATVLGQAGVVRSLR